MGCKLAKLCECVVSCSILIVYFSIKNKRWISKMLFKLFEWTKSFKMCSWSFQTNMFMVCLIENVDNHEYWSIYGLLIRWLKQCFFFFSMIREPLVATISAHRVNIRCFYNLKKWTLIDSWFCDLRKRVLMVDV